MAGLLRGGRLGQLGELLQRQVSGLAVPSRWLLTSRKNRMGKAMKIGEISGKCGGNQGKIHGKTRGKPMGKCGEKQGEIYGNMWGKSRENPWENAGKTHGKMWGKAGGNLWENVGKINGKMWGRCLLELQKANKNGRIADVPAMTPEQKSYSVYK